ncbi:MAG: four helix bundle protein [Opitutaceae bacterium]|nr:four helix bundle protein [Opitutaceae bacterium]
MRAQKWEEMEELQLAHRFTLNVHRLARRFPVEAKAGLFSQLIRAAISVSANIAEGKGRRTSADFRHFLVIACGSLAESRYLLMLARDLDYLDSTPHEEADSLSLELEHRLNKLIGKMNSSLR